jgi:hypothetical protein
MIITAIEKAMFCHTTRRAFLAQFDGRLDQFQLVAHQHHVGGFQRDIGPRRAHRNADVCRRQRRGVVHAVADHRHRAGLRLNLLRHRTLSSGSRSAYTRSMPSSWAMVWATRGLSPVSMATFSMPARFNPAMTCLGFRANLIGHRHHAHPVTIGC